MKTKIGQGAATKIVGAARAEKNFQKSIDRLQLALAKGEIKLSQLAESSKKELEAIRKMHGGILSYKQERLSDYSHLERMLNEEEFTKVVSLDSLLTEAKADAQAHSERSANCTEAQRQMLYAYYGQRARLTWETVSEFRKIATYLTKAKAKVNAPAQVAVVG